ncbi:MAG: prepilin-type N-terminal cleavage/methylation domain-containing protein [Candidatus Riflebacteria bacterium]|nr:prepilin-type N-terminal cleavage/methylation domain-containing protein [Candidatus Riflebacteria bacterium]
MGCRSRAPTAPVNSEVVKVVASIGRTGRRGFSLTEILVASVLFGLIGVALFELLSSGARSAAVASEHQLATMLTARTMDQLLSVGYYTLNEAVGTDEELDLAQVGGAGEAGTQAEAEASRLVADGFVFGGRYSIERADTGLLRLSVRLSWQRKSDGKQGGSLAVVRYLANPAAGISVRESFGGGQA